MSILSFFSFWRKTQKHPLLPNDSIWISNQVILYSASRKKRDAKKREKTSLLILAALSDAVPKSEHLILGVLVLAANDFRCIVKNKNQKVDQISSWEKLNSNEISVELIHPNFAADWSCIRAFIVMRRLVLFHIIQTYIPTGRFRLRV